MDTMKLNKNVNVPPPIFPVANQMLFFIVKARESVIQSKKYFKRKKRHHHNKLKFDSLFISVQLIVVITDSPKSAKNGCFRKWL